MAKKSLKSKLISKPSKININTITYDRDTFNLNGTKILTNFLTKETKKLLIKFYTKKKLNRLIKDNRKIDPLNQKYYVLTQDEAVQIIKHRALLKQRTFLEEQFKKNEEFLRKINLSVLEEEQRNVGFSKVFQKKGTNDNNIKKENSYETFKTKFRNTFFHIYKHFKQTKQQLQDNLNQHNKILRDFMATKILSIEMQLFVSTIMMIVQIDHQQKITDPNGFDDQVQNNQLAKVQSCMVVFQQAYPPKIFIKRDLIKIIGPQRYQQKKLQALKIYHTSITYQNFFNPTFITCHDCMRVITNVGFPQHDLKCLKTVNSQNQKNITSHFMITPQLFMQKFINHQFFNFDDIGNQHLFQHPYVQYHLKSLNDTSYRCGRHWCGPCFIKYRKKMDRNHCDFCDFNCQCTRCKRYQKFVKLLGHYVKIGGILSQIETKFVFNKVFRDLYYSDQYQNNRNNTENQNMVTKQFLKQHLKRMYQKEVKFNEKLFSSKQWLQLKKAVILSGVFPEDETAEQPLILHHKDQQKKKTKDQYDKLYQQEKKNYIKYAHQRKENNVELKISRLDETIKEKLRQQYMEQFLLLKRKFQRSKILKSSNPLMNNRLLSNNADVIIISESNLRKNERRFHQSLQSKEVNPIKQARQLREYRRVKRLQFQSNGLERNRFEQEFKWKENQEKNNQINVINKEKTFIEESSSKVNQQCGQNYGSIWE